MKDRKLDYLVAESTDDKHIETVQRIEESAFDPDPSEISEVIRYVSEKGDIIQVLVDSIPVGVLELISLKHTLAFDPDDIGNPEGVEDSPLKIIVDEQERVFRAARKYSHGDDSKILYHHGIVLLEDYQNKKIGQTLLAHGIKEHPDKVINCFVDLAQIAKKGQIEDAFNDRSFRIHLKNGFILADVIEPPVYDDELIYGSVLTIPGLKTSNIDFIEIDINHFKQNPKLLVDQIKDLLSQGYIATDYNPKGWMMFRMVEDF